MMNKVLTIGSFSLAVPAFIFIFVDDVRVAIISFAGTLAICILAFSLENIIRNKGKNIWSKIVHTFTKAKEYEVISREVRYSVLPDNKYEYRNLYEIKALTNGINEIRKKYAWSGETEGTLVPLEEAQKVDPYGYEDNYSLIGIILKRSILKKEKVTVGYMIKDLIDVNKKARPFLTTRISEKTAFLCQTIELSSRPNEIMLVVKNAAGRICYEKPLTYDEEAKKIVNRIDYPRLGWYYTIRWKIY